MIVNYNSSGRSSNARLGKNVEDVCGSPPEAFSWAMRTPWLLTLLLLSFVLSFTGARAQSSDNYAFSTNATGSLAQDMNGNAINMSSGTSTLVAASSDDTVSALTNLNLSSGSQFNFGFMGAQYSQFGVSDNGILTLGVVPGTGVYTLPNSTVPTIAAFANDMRVGTDGKVEAKIVGTAPNRTLVVQWTNNMIRYLSTAAAGTGTFQVRLYETTGVIEYVYGAMATNTSTPTVYYTGFSVGTAASKLVTVNTTANTATTSATATSNTYLGSATVAALHSTADGSRRVYRFTPPQTAPATPITFSGTAVTQTGFTINWVDNSTSEVFFVVSRSTSPAGPFTPIGTVASTTTAGTGTAYSLAQTGFLPGSTYYYEIKAGSEATFSSALSGSQSTNAAGNVTSIASGLWSAASTWSSGAVPTATDNVTISSGNTVTIDVTAAVANSLTVSGNLEYSVTTARTLTVATDVTVTGSFKSAATGTVTGHSLVINGSLTNNGTIDFSTNANTAGASITFGGASNASWTSGASSSTNLRSVTLNKGTSTSSVLTFTPAGTLTVQGANTAGFLTLSNGLFKLDGTGTFNNPLFSTSGYTIASTAGLWLNNANATIVGLNGSPTFSGLFRLSNGTFNSGTATGNSVGFSSGSTTIIEGGTVNAASRFGVGTSSNTITYTQSGGTINVNSQGNTSTSLASFDLGTSTTSTISMTGGTVNVILANTGGSGPRDVRGAASFQVTLTGGVINFGTAASGAAKTYYLTGYVPGFVISTASATHSLTLAGAAGSSSAVTIPAGSTFNLNGYRYIQQGTGLVNNGTITGTASSSDLYFFGSTAQTFSGTGTITAGLQSFSADTTTFGLTIDNAVSSFQVLRVNLFTGIINNSSKITLGTGAAAAVVVQTGAAGLTTPGGQFDVSPVWNLGTGTFGLVYAQESALRTTGFEVPPSRVVNTLTSNNTNGLTIAGGNLDVSSTLTMTAGIITTSASNVLGTLSGATLSGTPSATNMVVGPFARTFAASRTASGTYGNSTVMPVGKAGVYMPIFVDPTTTAAGTVTFRGEVFNTNTGTLGAGVTSLASNRWEAVPTAGAANLTNVFVRFTDAAITSTNKILQAPSAAGSYTSITPATTFTTSTLTTASAITAANYSGYFSYGNVLPCAAPTAQPTAFVTSSLTNTSFSGSFTAAAGSPTNYLVVRYPSGGTVTSPVDLTSYSAGGSLGAGTVVYSGTATSFSASGLTASTTYDVYVYSYNIGNACAGPVYYTVTPLTASVTTCAAATGTPGTPTLTSATSSSLTVSWTASSTAGVTYSIDVATNSGFTTFVPGYQNQNLGSVLTTTIPGLTASTTYYIRVKAITAGSCQSANSSSLTATTPCNSVTAFSENFDSVTTPSLPACWSSILRGTTISSFAEVSSTTTYYVSSPNSVKLYNSSSASTDDIILVSPPVSNLGAGTNWLRFSALAATTGESIQIGTLNGSGSSAVFTSLQSIALTSTMTEYTVSFASYTGSNTFIGLRKTNSQGGYTTIYVDDINWEPIPTCFRPTNLAFTSATPNTATFSWTAPSPAPSNGYVYEVRTSGAAGSGNTGLVASGSVAAGVLTATATGLTANTQYTVYVRSFCGGTDYSTWTPGAVFYSACNAITSLPWTENFDAMTTIGANVFPSTCWKSEGGNTGGYPYTSANAASNSYNDPRSAANYLTIYYPTTPALLYAPAVQLTAGTSYDFSFWWAGDAKAGWQGDVYVNSVQSQTGLTALGSSFVVPATTTVATYQQVTRSFTPSVTGTYYFVIKTYSATSAPFYMGFDDFKISVTPTTITSFTPSTACSAGGQTISISGASFTGATAVTFNGVAATSFTVNSASSISAVVPSGATTGPIVVVAPDGTATSATSLTINPSPVVSAIQNGNATVCMGDTVQLANATPGGTWSSLNPTIATVNASGLVTSVGQGVATIAYSVTDLGCTTQVTTTITVNSPITSTSPVAQTVVTGDTATYSVTATGSITGYQWMVSADGGDTFDPVVNDATYSGATTNTLTITGTPAELNGNLYMVVVSASAPCANFESGAAVLNVGDTGIETDPSNAVICSNGTGVASFTVVASGTVDAYAWEEDQGLGFTPITDGTFGGVTYSGATTDTLTISGLTLANTGWNYHAVVTGPANGATSNAASLTVNEGVAIATNPSTTSSCYSGGSAVFTVAASGAVAGYQWQYSTDNVNFSNVTAGTPAGATYSGATTASLTVNTTAATPAAGTYFYRALVNGASPCSAVASNGAQMTIYTPTVATQPSPATVFAGNSTTFTVSTTEPSASYQWQYAASASGPWSDVANNTPANITYANAATSTLTVNVLGAATAAANRYYRAVVTSGGCSVNSNAALLTTTNYCFPTYSAGPGTVDNIANVTLGTLNNTSGASTTPFYTVFDSAAVPDIQQLTTANVSVKFGNDTSNYCAVWIDFNHNGVFEASEGVAATSSSAGTAVANGTTVISIPVPLSAIPGKTRMRVRGGDDVAIPLDKACGASNDVDGEAEDYFVNIVAAPACSGTPATATASASSTSVCISGSVGLTATNIPSGSTGLSIQWYNTATGAISGATSATYTTPVITTTTSYFLRVTCADSGLYSDSNTVTVTVNNPSITATAPATRCGVGTVTLGATASAGANINWYAAATGGASLATGSSFVTPSISATTTYYVDASTGAAPVHLGPVSPAAQGGTTGAWTVGWNVNFTVLSATTLSSVVVYPVTSGQNGTFTVRSGSSTSGTVITTVNYTTNVSGGATPQIITFNTPLTAGTYNIYSDTLPTAGLTRNVAGASYPYTSSVATITGNGYDQTYYMGLYDWIFSAACTSARTAVVATVNTPPALTLSSSSASICSGTPSGSVTLTSNAADYNNYVWTPSTGVSGSAATGWTFNPSATTSYTLTATQTGGSQCANTAAFAVTVNPVPASFAVTPAASTVCVGDTAIALTAPAQTGSATLGTGTAVNGSNTTATAYPTPYGAYYENVKQQYLIRASELTAMGLQAGSSITSLAFNVTNVNGSGVHTAYTISMGNTSQTAIASFETNVSPVFGPVNYQPVVGLNTHTFTTPFIWNGTSNVVVQICHSNDTANGGVNFTSNAFVTYSTTTFNSSLTYKVDNVDACGSSSITYTEAERPNMVIAFNYKPTWSPSTGLYTDATATTPYTGVGATTVYAKPNTTTTYTATATNSVGCSKTATAAITVNQYYNFYVDADGDHYGTGAPVSFCAVSASAAPAGYASVSGDCDDTIAAVNPGHAEVPYNGIDDNCSGVIDEGSQLFSQVLPSQCGTTLATLGSLVAAVSFALPVDGYRFKVVNTATNAVQTIDATAPHFQLTSLASYDYATTYSISVMLRRNGVWLNYYGPSCLVSTPAVLDQGGAAAVTPSQCGIVLPTISTIIATTSLNGVTAYRFRVTNLTDGTAPNVQQVIERNLNWFSLTMLTRYNYGTQYQIEVAVKTASGTWSGYGTPCNVSSPAAPTLTDCGAVFTSTSTLVKTASLNRAQAYRFEITSLTTFQQIIVDRSQNWFTFTNVPNFTPGGVYAVRVAVQTSGYWSPFGEACEVTAPGAARNSVKGDEEVQPTVDFRAVVYPNPYTESFALDMDTSSDESVNVKVYDMIGKLLEDREFPIDRIEMQQFGERYPSGVYNIVVTQAGFVKTLRVIKR